MNTAPEDIMEVAVYGTQAACATHEEIAILVKEDPDETLEIPFEENDINHFTRHDNLLNTLLIYTTRLDHMRAFDKINKSTTKEITEMIEKESKPCYIQTPKLIKIEPRDANLTTFINLKYLVHRMNTIEQFEASRRNVELLKLCKPLRIVLTDILTEKKLMVKTDDEDAENTDTSSDDEPLSITATNLRLMRVNQHCNKAIAIKDKQAQEVDLYIIDKEGGVKNYYRTGKKQCFTLKKLHQIKHLIIMEYCCWINREKIIKTVAKQCSYNAIIYMRTPHNCLPRPCTCCCFKGSLQKKRNAKEINPILRSTSDCASDNKSLDIIKNNIIQKALHYQTVTQLDVNKNPESGSEVNYLKNAIILLKYHGLMLTQLNNILGENYVIGTEGKVINYRRPSVSHSLLEEKELYQKSDKPKQPRTYFSLLICCWYYREEAIAHICKKCRLLPSTLQFIKRPHPCRTFFCKCCCKPTPLFSLSKNTLQDNLNIVSSKNENRDFVNFNDFRIRQHCKSKEQAAVKYTQHRKRVKILNRQNKNKNLAKKKKVPNKSLQNIIDSAVVSSFQKKSSVNHPQAISNSTILKNIHPTIDPAVNVTNLNLAQPVDTKLTQNFIEKIKNCKLAVNENGKLTAILVAKPEHIPAADIKMISEVLSLAAEQIKILGITPQEFCNLVNNLNSVKRLNSIPMPKLTPISTNSTKPLNNELPSVRESLPTVTKTSQTTDFIEPKNSRSNQVLSIFQTMSSVGGQKNRHLEESYRTHFGEGIDVTSATRPMSKNKRKPPNITRRAPPVEKHPRHVRQPVLKRKKTEIVDTANVKRNNILIPINKLPSLDPYKKLDNSKTENVINKIPESKNNIITPQKTINAAVPCPTVAIATNKDIQARLDTNTSKTLQAQNFNVELVPSTVGNNVILAPVVSHVEAHHNIGTSNHSESEEISKDTIAETLLKDLEMEVDAAEIGTSNHSESAEISEDPDMEADAAHQDLNNIVTQINVSRTNLTEIKSVLDSNPLLINMLSKASSSRCLNEFGSSNDFDCVTSLKSENTATKENDDYNTFDDEIKATQTYNIQVFADHEEGDGIFGV